MNAGGCSSILNLPQDVLGLIFKKLSLADSLLLGTTCHHLQNAVNADDYWMELCKPWERAIRLEDWRQHALSGKALFRLLRSFSGMIGTWTSVDLSPRGGLLYVTWGNFSLVSWKVVPEALGRVSFIPLFEIVGCPDGSTKVELVSRSTNSRLPVALSWSSAEKLEFQLEVFGFNAPGISKSKSSDNESADGGAANNEFSLTLQQNLLLRGFALGPDDQRIPIPDEVVQHGRDFGQRAIQYLKRLASFRSNARNHIPSELKGVKFSYQKLHLESGAQQKITGLWSGVYGPHGLEIVAVYYAEGRIVATKILGDPHVPSNEVTFQADVASESRDISLDVQRLASMLNSSGSVVTVYKGEGRIAGYNFRNPKWVSGQLLLHESGGISFLWEDVNFVIRFHKLELQELFISEGAHQVALPRRL